MAVAITITAALATHINMYVRASTLKAKLNIEIEFHDKFMYSILLKLHWYGFICMLRIKFETAMCAHIDTHCMTLATELAEAVVTVSTHSHSKIIRFFFRMAC